MSATQLLQNPQVLASLPRPVDRSTGRYVVGDVFNGAGSKKRKRAELLVGIDGEGANLYDVQTAKLITSYALPPQSRFTCAPFSLRTKNTEGNGWTRRTYLSLKESSASVKLLKDDASANGTAATTTSHELAKSQYPIVHLVPTASTVNGVQQTEVLVVREDAELQVLRGDGLTLAWSSAAVMLGKAPGSDERLPLKVEFAHLTTVEEAGKGLLSQIKGVDLSEEALDTEILVLISRARSSDPILGRILQIIQLPRRQSSAATQPIQILSSAYLPEKQSQVETVSSQYKLHPSTGVLFELADGQIITYDLTETIPQLKSQLTTDSASSFLRLSATSILTASSQSVSAWNHKFKSLQATINVKEALSQDDGKRKQKLLNDASTDSSFQLIAYFPKIETVAAIADNKLVAMQVESQQSQLGKRRSTGLLIDSMGRGVQSSAEGKKLKTSHLKLNSFHSYVPGSGRSFWSVAEAKMKDLDKFVDTQDVAGFERAMVKNLEMKLEVESTNEADEKDETTDGSKPIPNWKWPKRMQDWASPDPGWIAYCLSRIFTWSSLPTAQDSTGGEPKLRISFFPHNVVNWLIRTGHLTVPNIEAAFKHTPEAAQGPATIPPGQFIEAIIEVDPELELLMLLMAHTLPSAQDLLCAIRYLMRSLELLNDGKSTAKLLTQGEATEDVDEDMEISSETADIEAALQLAEYHLGDGSNARGQALGLAMSKLYCHPSATIVQALQSTFTPAEIISLIYLLRFELAKGSWTSRYLDAIHLRNADDSIEESDTSITLISSLLNASVDAVGAGGWLSGTAMLANGDQYENEELIASLKLEVSAALEGIEEAEYLKGLTAEVIRYGQSVQRSLPPKERKGKKQPVTISLDQENTLLPFGLKVEQQVTRHKVGAGGELSRRTARDIGRLKSQKVGKYSRERIII